MHNIIGSNTFIFPQIRFQILFIYLRSSPIPKQCQNASHKCLSCHITAGIANTIKNFCNQFCTVKEKREEEKINNNISPPAYLFLVHIIHIPQDQNNTIAYIYRINIRLTAIFISNTYYIISNDKNMLIHRQIL